VHEGTADRSESARPYTLTPYASPHVWYREDATTDDMPFFHGLDMPISLICVTCSRPGILRIREKNSRYSTENAMNQVKVMDVVTDLHHEWATAPWDPGPFMRIMSVPALGNWYRRPLHEFKSTAPTRCIFGSRKTVWKNFGFVKVTRR